jgi:hypothetical protein
MAERSVGLVVMTEIPGMGLVAVLRERKLQLREDEAGVVAGRLPGDGARQA